MHSFYGDVTTKTQCAGTRKWTWLFFCSF